MTLKMITHYVLTRLKVKKSEYTFWATVNTPMIAPIENTTHTPAVLSPTRVITKKKKWSTPLRRPRRDKYVHML